MEQKKQPLCPCYPITIPDNRKVVYTDHRNFPWKSDPKGYFLIKLEKGNICCGHVSPQHRMTVEFRGKNPMKIMREICSLNLVKNYEHVGFYFREIVEKVDFGTSLEDSLNETIIMTPSPELRKVLWQVLNSMRTGADIAGSLTVVLDQIVREQKILVNEYGRKLNPLAMFFMMIAIIIPSLGIVMLIVMATFLGFSLTLGVLCALLVGMAFVQFMFLALIKSSRPAVDM